MLSFVVKYCGHWDSQFKEADGKATSISTMGVQKLFSIIAFKFFRDSTLKINHFLYHIQSGTNIIFFKIKALKNASFKTFLEK